MPDAGSLIAVLIGGAIVIVGSVYVIRLELTRRTRVELLRTHVPALLEAANGLNYWPVEPTHAPHLAENICREAMVASQADRNRARSLQARVDEAKNEYWAATPDPANSKPFKDANAKVIREAEAYRDWLQDSFDTVGGLIPARWIPWRRRPARRGTAA